MQINYDRLITGIRKLTKSSYWQTVSNNAREYNGIRLFRNDTDFSYLQILFLQYLNFYHAIYFDIANDEISDTVLEHVIYEDAYMYWKEKGKDKTPIKSPSYKDKSKQHPPSVVQSEWTFRKKRKN